MLVRTLDALLRANVRSGRVVMLALVPIMLVALAGGLAGMHYWRFRIVFVILAILALWFVARREVLAALICPICRQVKRVKLGRAVPLAWKQFLPFDPQCLQCGYSIMGVTAARCPECGDPFPEVWLAATRISDR
jgi:hypothetical protein